MPKNADAKRPAALPPVESFVESALEQGALRAKIVAPTNVVTGEWVRWKCQFGCGGFGASLVCPPHTPTPAQTRKLLDEYAQGLLFEAPPDRVKELAFALEREIFLAGYYRALGLGAGPCLLCEKCALAAGCRHPTEARPSLEACGIDVYATVHKHDYEVNVVHSDRDPQHYYGLVLIA